MKYYLTSILLAVAVGLQAQGLPVWYNASSRASTYPSDVYITGFAMQKVGSGESVESAIASVTEKARVNAVSTIQVRVKNETEDRMEQLQYKMEGTAKNAMQRYLQSVTRSSVDMEVTGLKIETCYDAANGRVAGFAFVKKAELIRQTDRKLTQVLSKIENGLDEMEELSRTAQKMQARKRGEKLAQLFVQADELQRLLIAVDPFADDESLQTEQLVSLQKRYLQAMSSLQNGIYVCLKCTATLPDGRRYTALKGEITGALSPLGCSFTDNEGEADWLITVDAESREYNAHTAGEYTSYFVYIDADVSVTKVKTGQTVYEDRLTEKGSHTHNYEQAARDGYKNISPKISAIIKQQIQQ
ncbi:MAG: hypothetical protein J6Y00_05585 [Paludibacteraceae bacterium]|nr:hypothetical protein [Paludibacteraceae bacterium]